MVKIIGNKIVDKNCQSCDVLMIGVNCSTKFCPSCNAKSRRESYLKFNVKKQNQYLENKEFKKEELIEKFKEIVNEPYHLTTVGFNEISPTKVKAYCQFFEMQWTDIIRLFGYFDTYYDYVKKSYMECFEETGLRGMDVLCNYNKYIKRDVLFQLNLDQLKLDCGIQKYRYSDEEYKDNFISITNNLGRVPLYMEFLFYTKITLEAYSEKYKLKGIIYDKIVKMFVDKDAFREYKMMAKSNQFESLVLKQISEILECDYIPQSTFDWLINEQGYILSIDGYYEKFKLMVEADGQQHKQAMGYFGGDEKLIKQKANDTIKDKLVADYGYKMLRIDYDSDWMNKDYLTSRLKELNISIPNQQIA